LDNPLFPLHARSTKPQARQGPSPTATKAPAGFSSGPCLISPSANQLFGRSRCLFLPTSECQRVDKLGRQTPDRRQAHRPTNNAASRRSLDTNARPEPVHTVRSAASASAPDAAPTGPVVTSRPPLAPSVVPALENTATVTDPSPPVAGNAAPEGGALARLPVRPSRSPLSGSARSSRPSAPRGASTGPREHPPARPSRSPG